MLTVIITSCNRFDLLCQTLDSFLKVNQYPVERYILTEDSCKQAVFEKIQARYPFIECYLNPKKLGYAASLDFLLSKVQTPWVFNIEDDWSFELNPGFIEDSVRILKARPDIHQVWIRHEWDFEHPLTPHLEWIEGVPVKRVTKGYLGIWGGFSLNPGLRSMEMLKKFFPEGLVRAGAEESILSRMVNEQGYEAVVISDNGNATIRHIGWNRHTKGFRH